MVENRDNPTSGWVIEPVRIERVLRDVEIERGEGDISEVGQRVGD